MSNFRSQTDEQLATQWDPFPYVTATGARCTKELMENAMYPPSATLSPRVEFIPSRDPEPWLHYCGQFGCTGHRESFERTGMDAEWSPHPEFARPPVNRVLVTFRLNRRKTPPVTVQRQASAWLASLSSMAVAFTPAEIDHAHKVLEHLVALG